METKLFWNVTTHGCIKMWLPMDVSKRDYPWMYQNVTTHGCMKTWLPMDVFVLLCVADILCKCLYLCRFFYFHVCGFLGGFFLCGNLNFCAHTLIVPKCWFFVVCFDCYGNSISANPRTHIDSCFGWWHYTCICMQFYFSSKTKIYWTVSLICTSF